MTTKYIIQMMHHRSPGDDFPYYYKGQNKEGCNLFDFRKNLAKRYDFQEEAIRDMNILKAVHVAKTQDAFSVISIKCRV